MTLRQTLSMFGTMLTALLIILGMGFTIQYEDAVVANVTIIPTDDDCVRYSAVNYTDGVTCIVSPYNKRYRYNTVADAEEAWQANNPPFKSTRGRTAFIDSETCGAFLSGGDGGIGFYAYLCYFFLILGVPLDCLCIRHFCAPLYEWYRERRQDSYCDVSRPATIVPQYNDNIPTTVTITVHGAPPTSLAPPPMPLEGATATEPH